MLGEEMSKLEDNEAELHGGGLEDNGYSLLSEFEEHEDSTQSDDEEGVVNPKDFRDLAEGKNLNNSFTGSSYPENWDHLHIDKGPNPQFQSEVADNNIFGLASKILFG